MNLVESQIFAWVLHFRQLSYKLDYRENQTGVQRLKNIQEDIKTGKFKQAYLLYGEEAYLKQQYKRNLVKALNPDDDTMNFTRYEGKGIDVRELLSLCDTMPFFAERRVVLLEDTGFFKNKCEELADYMKALPDYLYLVFCESEVDKRSRMYKAVKACGSIGEFKQQDEKTLMRWAAGILGKKWPQDHPERCGASADHDGNRYGKYKDGAGKADLLYGRKRCCDGCRHPGCLYHADNQ